MSRRRASPRISLAGRLTLLCLLPLGAAAAAAATASWFRATPRVAFLVTLLVGVPVAFLTLSRALRPSVAILEALSDGVDGWRSGDFSLRLAPSERADELGRLVGLYNEIGTTLRRERNELRQRELLLQTVLETSPAAVLLLSDRGIIELANRQARLLFRDGHRLRGYAFEEFLAHAPEGLRSGLAQASDRLVTLDTEGGDETFHITRRRFELNTRHHELLMIHRITAQLRRQEVAAWKKVLRVIAHELNNSLAPIRSVAHTARGMLSSGRPEKLAEALETIDDSAARLHQFIDGYARFARLPAPRREPVDLTTFVAELGRLESFVSPKPTPRREFQADPSQLQQALLNLLRNAREAGSPADEIVLEVDDLGPAGLRFEVRDRGQGMSEETMSKALLPFFSSKPEGTGLGLALAREIMEAHGGRLQLSARTEGGLAVTCWLPPGPAVAGRATSVGQP